MINKDILQKFIFEKTPVRGEIVRLNESYKIIMKQHDYPLILRKMLGEALAATVLLAATIKFQGRLTLQFRGTGGLKLLVTQCDQSFQLRGLIQWEGDFTEEQLQSELSQGTLAIMMDPDIEGGRRYQGMVAWKGESLAEALEGYFYQSEQLPTRLWLNVNEENVSGMLLQVMPQEKPELYENDWERIVMMASTLKNEELSQLENPVLLGRLYPQDDLRLFDLMPVTFSCTCSIERSEYAISLLGKEEAEQELKTKKELVVTCEFCQKQYVFDKVDVARIFSHGDKPPSTQLH